MLNTGGIRRDAQVAKMRNEGKGPCVPKEDLQDGNLANRQKASQQPEASTIERVNRPNGSHSVDDIHFGRGWGAGLGRRARSEFGIKSRGGTLAWHFRVFSHSGCFIMSSTCIAADVRSKLDCLASMQAAHHKITTGTVHLYEREASAPFWQMCSKLAAD